MPDEVLLLELETLAMGLGMDARYLIWELIKRYKIRCFEVQMYGGKVGVPPHKVAGGENSK